MSRAVVALAQPQHQRLPQRLARPSARGPSRLLIPSPPLDMPWSQWAATSIVSAASSTTLPSQTLTNTPLRRIPGHPLSPFRRREVGSAAQLMELISTCLVAWTKTLTPRPHYGATIRPPIPTIRACRLLPFLPTSTPAPISTAKSTVSQAPLLAPIFTSKFMILPQIPGPWLQTTHLLTIT